MTDNKFGHGAPQEVNLTSAQLTNLIKEAIISILIVQGLTKDSLLLEIQKMIAKAIAEVVPKRDPEEDIYFTSGEVELFLGISHTTVSKYKHLYLDGKPILPFEGLGRIQRITKAACRRAMRHLPLRPSALKKRIEFPERLRRNNKKK